MKLLAAVEHRATNCLMPNSSERGYDGLGAAPLPTVTGVVYLQLEVLQK